MTALALDSLVPTLDGLLTSIQSASPADNQWRSVEACAKQIADGLRTRNGPVDNHSQLSKSALPETLNGLVKEATRAGDDAKHGGRPSSPASAAATYELLRVGANLCMDHDGNRQRLLEAGYTDSVLSILKAYLRDVSKPSVGTATLSDLKLVKTAVGVLLNASMSYEPVRTSLVTAGAPLTVLSLSSRLYSPGAWASATSDDALEQWGWRSGLSAWSWRALETLRGGDDADPHEERTAEWPSKQHSILDAGAVQPLIGSLHGFVPPHPPAVTSAAFSKADRQKLVVSDMEVLEETSMLLESLTLDSVDVRQAIAAGSLSSPTPTVQNPFPPPPLLTSLLDFVEKGAPPGYWDACTDSEAEKKRWSKSFGICKAAVIKAVVALAGEDKNLDVLWDSQVGSYPGGPFVERMVGWIKNTRVGAGNEGVDDEGRDDLIICATLSLGNLARRPLHCIALLAPPISLTPHLIPLLDAKTNIKLKHGCIGLLKHLAQPPPNKGILGDANFIEALVASRVWTREGDIGEPVQFGAVGVVKHLSYEYLPNALKLSKPEPSLEGDSALDLILDLVRRSDSIGLQSEGTRVLVNVVKCLFSSASSKKPNGAPALSPNSNSNIDLSIRTTGLGDSRERQQAIDRLATMDSVELLTDMLGRSGRYPILLNEGVVALTLLSSVAAGRSCVLQSLLSPLPYALTESGAIQTTAPPPAGQAQISAVPAADLPDEKVVAPSNLRTWSPLDMLVAILRNVNGAFPPELGANVCTLLVGLTPSTTDASQEKEFGKIRVATRSALESVAAGLSGRSFADGPPKVVQTAAKRTLDVWQGK